jgi:NAD+ synthetase
MRVHNPQHDQAIMEGLTRTLAELRARRGFDAESYIAAKAVLLNGYMRKYGLGGCVVGVSGGVDSALVFAIIVTASRMDGSPIRRVLPLLMPIHTRGATNQKTATDRGREVLARFGYEPGEIDLTKAFHAMEDAVDAGAKVKGSDWAVGQLASYLRTPALYYASSLMAQEGIPSLVIGTTNRDEGAYLGFFGKASDATVDLQLISDIHKSEVWRAGKALSLPKSILEAAPTGDMFDGRLDVEVFGASYDFVELFLNMKCLPDEDRNALMARWSTDEKAQYERFAANLENLHRYNAHKYIVGSPAVHLDLYPSAVPGGWQYGPKSKGFAEDVNKANFVAPFDLSPALLQKLNSNPHRSATSCTDLAQGDKVFTAENLLEAKEASALLDETKKQKWLPANVHGMRGSFDPAKDKTGSWRASSYSTQLSNILWRRLEGLLPMIEHIPDGTSADAHDCMVWRACGVSPLFRFIKYASDGTLVAHYDAPFDFGDGRRTLKSMIVYLTEGQAAGATRFVRDTQQNILAPQRDYADWTRCAQDNEVIASFAPGPGSALIFNHRILHDSAPTKSTAEKIVMRADIVYEKVLPP